MFGALGLDLNAEDAFGLKQWFNIVLYLANNALKYVPECTAIDDNKKAAYLGDAYFLRALYYSQMIALWGPIPYNAEPINAINNNPVRVPEAEV